MKPLNPIGCAFYWCIKNAKNLFCVALIIYAMAFLFGCKSPEKAIDYLKKKGALAGACADNYPVKDSIIYKGGDTVTNTVETPGVTITKTDTVFIDGKVIYKTSFIKCPPSKETTKTIHDTVTVYIENTAKIAVLNNIISAKDAEIKAITADKEKFQKRAGRWWLLLIIGAGLMFVGRLALKSII